jgi:hypothetical protein
VVVVVVVTARTMVATVAVEAGVLMNGWSSSPRSQHPTVMTRVRTWMWVAVAAAAAEEETAVKAPVLLAWGACQA